MWEIRITYESQYRYVNFPRDMCLWNGVKTSMTLFLLYDYVILPWWLIYMFGKSRVLVSDKRYQINVCWIIFNDNVYQIFCLAQCRCFLSNSIFWILIQKFSLTVPPIQSVCPHLTCWSKSFTDTYKKELNSYLVWEGSNYGECISLPEFFKLSLFASKF